jgi:hypothetical protein
MLWILLSGTPADPTDPEVRCVNRIVGHDGGEKIVALRFR